jgi:hypothetical protein
VVIIVDDPNQHAGHALNASRQLVIASSLAVVADRRLVRQAPRDIEEQRRQVDQSFRKLSRHCRLAVLGQ